MQPQKWSYFSAIIFIVHFHSLIHSFIPWFVDCCAQGSEQCVQSPCNLLPSFQGCWSTDCFVRLQQILVSSHRSETGESLALLLKFLFRYWYCQGEDGGRGGGLSVSLSHFVFVFVSLSTVCQCLFCQSVNRLFVNRLSVSMFVTLPQSVSVYVCQSVSVCQCLCLSVCLSLGGGGGLFSIGKLLNVAQYYNKHSD